LGNVRFYALPDAILAIVTRLYSKQPLPKHPKSRKTLKQTERNNAIRARYAEGVSVHELAKEFGISQQRIHQILRGKRK